MKSIKLIKLFISCPGDVKEEIDSIKLITEEINKTIGRQNNYSIECLHWSVDTYTQIAEDSQQVINEQIDSEYDILVGLLWQRLGTPTKRDKSGTVEEINRALKNISKQQLIYFKTATPENLNLIDIEGLEKINSYKKQLQDQGVLYKEFNSIKEFESLFRINLINLIADLLSEEQDTNGSSEKDLKRKDSDGAAEVIEHHDKDKYASIEKVIELVEKRIDDPAIGIDVFELMEKLMSALFSVTSTTEAMTVVLNELTENMTKRTNELKIYNVIKDDRLRMNKIKIVVNLFSKELNVFNAKIKYELPRFSENLLLLGPAYAQIFLYGINYDIPEAVSFKQSIVELRNSLELSTKNNANLLQEILAWPSINVSFNTAKRETEITLKDLTKEMLEGLKLLDEAIQ